MRWRALLLALLLATPTAAETLDRADGKTTEIKIWEGEKCGPLAILSHGLGGDTRTLSRIALMLNSDGYRVITMGHAESGRAALRQVWQAADRRAALLRAAGNPASYRARHLDLDATLAFATKDCRPSFMVLLGHSMGAQTTIMEAGAVPVFGWKGRNRFDAYVALSPQGVGSRFHQGAWRAVNKPVLMVTGTKDKGVDGGYETRLSAFEGLPRGQNRLAIVKGGTHMHMGGFGAGSKARTVRAIIQAYLRDLRGGALPKPADLRGVTYRQK